MNPVKDFVPVTQIKNRASDLLDQINRTRRPVIITQNGEPRGVLQDMEIYEDMRKALGMLRLLAQGEADFRESRTVSHDKALKMIRKRMKEQGAEGMQQT